MLKYAETSSILNYFQCLLFYNQKCARFIDIGLFTGHKLDLCDFCGESSRTIFNFHFSIFIAMLRLYGTSRDTRIWAKIISECAKKCSRDEGFRC